MDFNSDSFHFDNNIFIPFSLMWPSLRCHRLVSVLASAIAIVSLGLEVIYRVPVFFPRANTLAPFVTFQVPPTNSIACPSSSSYLTEIKFLLSSGICRTFSSNQTDPLGNNIRTSPIPTTSKAEPSAKYTWGNYTKPICGLAWNHFAYPWFKKCHFTHLKYVLFVFCNPPLLKSGVNRYFCSNFMSLSSQNKI